MCPDCRDEVTSKNRCTRCGKKIPDPSGNDDDDAFVNPNFDNDEYVRKSQE